MIFFFCDESGTVPKRKALPLSGLAVVLTVAGMVLGGVQAVSAGPGACVDPSECYGLPCNETGGYAGACVPDGACTPYYRQNHYTNSYYYGCIYDGYYRCIPYSSC